MRCLFHRPFREGPDGTLALPRPRSCREQRREGAGWAGGAGMGQGNIHIVCLSLGICSLGNSKVQSREAYHTQVIYSSSFTGNPMISSTTSQLFSHSSLPACDALGGGKGGSIPTAPQLPRSHQPHQLQPRGSTARTAGISPNCSHVGATAPAATQSPKCFQAGEAPAAAWRHSHRGMGASVSPAACASTPQMSRREHYSLQLPN